jgi:acetolactate synthase-1/2/3 large subunit
MQINGAQMVIEAFIAEGVDTVFGYPGGAIMNVYDEIYKQDGFKHILNRHEQASLHAAEGYAKASGKVGVAMITSGPGFTNAVTGLADAYMDSIPMVVISGQVPMSLIGTDAFQEIDAVGISRSCTKHNYLVTDAADLPRILKEAFYIARTGRPGPVHVDIPKDVTAQVAEFDYDAIKIELETYKPHVKGNPRQIKKAMDAIAKATRPLFYLGGGIINANATDEVREFVKKSGIPAVETFMARGVLSHDDELLVGMLGMHGSYASNMAMSETDLVIGLGARFDDRVTGKLSEFAKNAGVIHVDIDPASISKLVNADYPIVGDVKNVVVDMLEQIEKIDATKYKSWRETVKNFDELHPLTFHEDTERLKPQWVVKRVGELLGDDANISTDVGQHQMWSAQFYPFSRPRQFMSSGGLGTMGYGFPAALGVKVATPDKISINFTGDGSILMNVQELMTAVEKKIPVINIILNNNYLGMVRQWQTLFYDKRHAETDLSVQPDFVKLSEAFGGIGYRVHTKEEFDAALKDAVEKNVVAFIEVIVHRMENVMPMVPAGGSLFNMMLLEKKESK